MTKGSLLYEGKAKKVFAVQEDASLVWLQYKDSLTAFNAQKKGEFSGKGAVNMAIATEIFKELKKAGLSTHWVENVSATEMIVAKLDMIPLEVVVRNRAAGSLAKKLGLEEGTSLNNALVEFYFKNDDLGDPFVSDEQIQALNLVQDMSVLPKLKNLALEVNTHLLHFFKNIGLELIDFKLEFGIDRAGAVVLADEITPDSCRLWDVHSGEKMDKDRFRRDLGRVQESYEEVLQRIQKQVGAR